MYKRLTLYQCSPVTEVASESPPRIRLFRGRTAWWAQRNHVLHKHLRDLRRAEFPRVTGVAFCAKNLDFSSSLFAEKESISLCAPIKSDVGCVA